MKPTIVINRNPDFTSEDEQVQEAYTKRAIELVHDVLDDCMVVFCDIGTTYSWKCYDTDISDEDGFFIQGALEQAWNDAHYQDEKD